MHFTTTEIADITAGERVGPEVTTTGVGIDSRSIAPSDLFVPLVAERDGHAFIDHAMTNGAAAHLTSKPSNDGPAVVVDDTETALTLLGRAARDRLDAEVIGITGSVGKTSVKDLLAAVVATTRRTHASPRSFNNEFGVPLTLANAPEDTEVLIQEMGARGLGHISQLCEVASPTAGVVTMVAPVHTSEFSSIEEIAQGKRELVEAIPQSGFVVLNQDDERVWAMRIATKARVIGFGAGAEVRADDIEVDDRLRPHFQLVTPKGSASVVLSLRGEHQVMNALAAAATGHAMGLDPDVISQGLESAVASPWRMEVRHRDDGVVIINDAYNANPTSMRAAFDALSRHQANRRFAILGSMAELGPSSEEDHAAIGSEAVDRGFTAVTIAEPSYRVGKAVDTPEEAIEALGELGDGDVILVKASRAAGLERVAQLLG